MVPNAFVSLGSMGVARVRVVEFTQFEPYLRSKIQTVQDEKEDENSVDFQALRRTVVGQFERVVKLSPQLPDDLQTIVVNMRKPLWPPRLEPRLFGFRRTSVS